MAILENEVYKGDFIHGKRTKHPTLYKDVVEPIISRELWEDCQVQKKKNSRSYQRTLTYLFLQKIRCPRCNRLMGGKATKKKNGNIYYYYYCTDCKLNIKESEVEKYFNEFIDELVEYDSVVNQFFLPMIKQKFDEPKEQLEKEIIKQKSKLDRIRKAYIEGVFDINEYNTERKIANDTLDKLQKELDLTNRVDILTYTPEDILLKRDINYINRVKFADEYNKRTKTWKQYSREEKAELIMKYVDDIMLLEVNKYLTIDKINFRQTLLKNHQELFDSGYLDVKCPVLFGDVLGYIRVSNYISDEDFSRYLMRLRQYYHVGFQEVTYYLDRGAFYFNFIDNECAIIRVFPREDYAKIDPDLKMKEYTYGILYIYEDNQFRGDDVSVAFDYIPDETNTSVVYSKEPISIGVKPVRKELIYEDNK